MAPCTCSVCLAKEKEIKIDTSKLREIFRSVMEWLHAAGAFRTRDLKLPILRQLISETAAIFNDAIDTEIKTVPPSDVLVQSLKQSGYVFSGFKAFNMAKQAELLLVDENGEIKPFNRFLNDIKTLDETYNERYLYTEYKFAVASAQMADKWKQFERDGDRFDLQYRTANDERVRDTHAELHNVTLPFDSPFWDKYFPPNGWGCRCTVVQVRKGKYPLSNLADAMKKGDEATSGKFQKMFRFNPGKSKQLFPSHNPYTPSKCAGCDIAGYPLAKIPDNELCQACPIIREMAKRKYKNKYKPFKEMGEKLASVKQSGGFLSEVATSKAIKEKIGYDYAIVTEADLLHATRDSKVAMGKTIPIDKLISRLTNDLNKLTKIYWDKNNKSYTAVVRYNNEQYIKYVFREIKRVKGITDTENKKLVLKTVGLVEEADMGTEQYVEIKK